MMREPIMELPTILLGTVTAKTPELEKLEALSLQVIKISEDTERSELGVQVSEEAANELFVQIASVL